MAAGLCAAALSPGCAAVGYPTQPMFPEAYPVPVGESYPLPPAQSDASTGAGPVVPAIQGAAPSTPTPTPTPTPPPSR